MKRFVALLALICACSDKKAESTPVSEPPPSTRATAITAPKVGAKTILLAQAQFKWVEENGERKAKPGAAKLLLLTLDGDKWQQRVVEDEDSRVFHKAACVDGGVLTIGATQAKLKLWTPDLSSARTLWSPTFGGKWDRLRDFESLDANTLAIATHDQGVVALLSRSGDDWTARELTRKADTFVHEIEVGDVDGDGKAEIYATPSDPNKANTSQAGGIAVFEPPSFDMSTVATFSGSHAKEILVADIDGEPGLELYAAVEAELVPGPSGATVSQPVEIRQYVKRAGRWLSRTVAKLERAMQARVLLAADIVRSGKPELIVSTMKDGIWRLTPAAGQAPWVQTQIDAESSGFEHAAQAYDANGDGLAELYVAADDQDEVRQYTWTGETLKRTTIAKLEKSDITWNIMGCGRNY